jgi:hypothetical protein
MTGNQMRHHMPRVSFFCVTAAAWFIAAGGFDGSEWLPSAVADSPERLPPRPERTAAERKERADELRRVYSGDPATWPVPHVDPGVNWKEIGLLH